MTPRWDDACSRFAGLGKIQVQKFCAVEMMRSQRSDVVLVNYPFASGGGTETRPALVVECDANNRRLENTLIVQITSRIRC